MSFYLQPCKDLTLIDLPYKALVLWDGGASWSSLSSGLG